MVLSSHKSADRKALTRTAKANVKYDDCDGDEDGNDHFPPSQKRCRAPERRPTAAAGTIAKLQLKEVGGKDKRDRGKHAKPKGSGKISGVQATPPPVSVSKRSKRKEETAKDKQPPRRGWAEDDGNDPAAEVSVTVGAHACSQNPSPASSLKYVPDTNDTVARTRAKAKENPIQAPIVNVRSEPHANFKVASMSSSSVQR